MPDPYILLPDGSRATLDHDADYTAESYRDDTRIHGSGHCWCGADAAELNWRRFGYCWEDEAVVCPFCLAIYEVIHA